MKYLLGKGVNERIVKCDESFWRKKEFKLNTWARKGASDVVIENEINEKKGFSFLANISVSGRAFPLILIASGKTKRVEENWFGAGMNISTENRQPEKLLNPIFSIASSAIKNEEISPSFLTNHSKKCWSNSETWLNYLKVLRNNWIPRKTEKPEISNRI